MAILSAIFSPETATVILGALGICTCISILTAPSKTPVKRFANSGLNRKCKRCDFGQRPSPFDFPGFNPDWDKPITIFRELKRFGLAGIIVCPESKYKDEVPEQFLIGLDETHANLLMATLASGHWAHCSAVYPGDYDVSLRSLAPEQRLLATMLLESLSEDFEVRIQDRRMPALIKRPQLEVRPS
ncbi:hypothetical protein TWF696_002640 [Orbilia brochopaga]|uniref:Uncharacterized protein n=1 Tax=Orbilia brochopaga TaxID=3140254 RepID=A0AAV9U653_9PEZI